MNLSALRTFLAIVETGSLVRAADQLNVTQSTVTARLQSLETELGQPLIRRRKSGAVLTPAGERLRRYAQTISDLWQQARQETALPDGFRGVCNIACDTDLWPHLGQSLYARVRSASRDLAMTVWTGSTDEVSEWLSSGKADLALTYRPAAEPDLDRIPIGEERLLLVSTDAQAPVRFDPGYILVEAGRRFARDHATAYADADVARLGTGSASLALELILDHGGSAYLPERMAAPHLLAGRLHKTAQAPEFRRPVFLIVHRDARLAWPWFDQLGLDLAAALSNP